MGQVETRVPARVIIPALMVMALAWSLFLGVVGSVLILEQMNAHVAFTIDRDGLSLIVHRDHRLGNSSQE